MSTITDVKSARALIRFERDRNRIVYAEYIAANEVTLESVSDHVKALAELAFPDFSADASDEVKAERKGFMNRVRNGLNHRLGKVSPSKQSPTTPATGEDAAGEAESVTTGADPATVTATPEQAVTLAIRAAVAAGLSRADILAAVEAGL